MRFTLRATATAGALALLASGLVLPLARPAAAADAIRLWTLVDTDGDQLYELGLWNGSQLQVVEKVAQTDLSDLSASADGTRVTYVRDTPSTEQVVVRDHSALSSRAVVSLPISGDSTAQAPLLSPDGRTVVWTHSTFTVTSTSSDYVISIRRADVASGRLLGTTKGYAALGFLDGTTLLVQGVTTNANKYFSLSLTDGTLTPLGGSTLPADADQIAISPDGTRIAWYQDTTNYSANPVVPTGLIRSAALTGAGGTWTVTGPVSLLSSSGDNEEPAFSRDGTTVYWVRWDGLYYSNQKPHPGQVLSRSLSDSAPKAATTSTDATDDEFDVALTDVPTDTTPPASPVTPLTAVLTGTTATLRWTLPDDASGAVVSREGRSPAYALGTSFTDSGLVLGQTYEYSLAAFDRAGNVTTSTATVQLQAVQAKPVVADPTSTASTRTPFSVTFGPAAGAGLFTVEFQTAGSTTWQPWVEDSPVRSATFGSAASTGVRATSATAGQTYTFRAHAVDAYGNSTPTLTARTTVPLDQTKAAFSGGTTVASSASYLGSYRKLTTTAQYARITLTGNRFQVIGLRCSGCGSFAVYEGSTRVGTGNSYDTTTKARQVLFTRIWSTVGTRTLTLKPLGTSGHPAVLLDGFAMRR